MQELELFLTGFFFKYILNPLKWKASISEALEALFARGGKTTATKAFREKTSAELDSSREETCVENVLWICNIGAIFKLAIFCQTGLQSDSPCKATHTPQVLNTCFLVYVRQLRQSSPKGDFGSSHNAKGVMKCWVVWSFLLWQTEGICELLANDSLCWWAMVLKTGEGGRWQFPHRMNGDAELKTTWTLHQWVCLTCPTDVISAAK